MDLDDAELHELAAFLGRRLDIQLTATPPPAGPREAHQRTLAWTLALEEARDSGKLSALMARIARRHPDDANLQAATRLLSDGERGVGMLGLGLVAGAGGVAVAGLMSAALVLAFALTSGSSASVVPLPAAPVAAVAAPVEASIEAARPAPDVSQVAVQADREPIPTDLDPIPTGRCTRPDGGPVGWWDAGAAHPGEAGVVVRVQGQRNVRAEHPHRGNRWKTDARIQCVLRPGDAVRLGQPVRVDGGRWWVPLRTGDLLGPSVL